MQFSAADADLGLEFCCCLFCIQQLEQPLANTEHGVRAPVSWWKPLLKINSAESISLALCSSCSLITLQEQRPNHAHSLVSTAMSKDAYILVSSVEGTLFKLFSCSQEMKRKSTFLFPCSHCRNLINWRNFCIHLLPWYQKLSVFSQVWFAVCCISQLSHWYHVCCIALVEHHVFVIFLFSFLPLSSDLGRLLSAVVIC